MIDRNSPIPIYYQLKLHFKHQVETGDLVPGDRLPTEMELCEEYQISRAPVRQALNELAREGLIYRRPGQGSFIASLAPESLEQKTKIIILSHEDIRWTPSLEEAARIWNHKEPDHEIELDVRMCRREEFHRVLRLMTIQGEAPDLVPMDYNWIHHYASEGYITPLNMLDPVWVDEVCDAMELQVLKNNTVKGYLFGVPIQTDFVGLWYRKDWFQQEGIERPATWDEWIKCIDYFAAPDVMERLGYKYPIVLPVTSATSEAAFNLLVSFIWLSGVNDSDSQSASCFNDAAVYKALLFLREMLVERRAFLPEDMYQTAWRDLVRLFARSDIPMLLGGTNDWPAILEVSPWENEADTFERLGFTMLPRPSLENPPAVMLGGASWVIFKQSKVQDLCLELLKISASPDVADDFYINNAQISPYMTVNRQSMKQEHSWLASIVPLMQYAHIRPTATNYIQVENYVHSVIKRVLWDGVDIEDAVVQISQTLALVLPDMMD